MAVVQQKFCFATICIRHCAFSNWKWVLRIDWSDNFCRINHQFVSTFASLIDIDLASNDDTGFNQCRFQCLKRFIADRFSLRYTLNPTRTVAKDNEADFV